MLRVEYASALVRLPVWSLQVGEPIAELGPPIIDPSTLQVVAFHVKYEQQKLILPGSAIREIVDQGVAIDHEEVLAPITDTPKIAPLAEADWSPLGLQVVTKSGQLLGVVADYTVAGDDFHIYQLLVEPEKRGWWRTRRRNRSLLVNRSQILEYNDTRFIVRDSAEVELADRIDFSKFYNPFRTSLLDQAAP